MGNTCNNCQKPEDLCVCQHIQACNNRTKVLILQHPQEPDKDLGSARLASLALKNSSLRIGLSWRNLRAALGVMPGAENAVPSEWGVLHLGSGLPQKPQNAPSGPQLFALIKGKAPLPSAELTPPLKGLIVLDGTWSQAKALWWRNPWLLKCRRLVLVPNEPSLYKELRREPRRECLSTIESIAQSLTALGEDRAIATELQKNFSALLQKYRQKLQAKRASRATTTVPDPKI